MSSKDLPEIRKSGKGSQVILRSRLFKRSGDKPRWHLLLPFLRVIKGFTFVSCRLFPLTLASFVTFSSELVTFAALLTQLLSGIVGPSAGGEDAAIGRLGVAITQAKERSINATANLTTWEAMLWLRKHRGN